MLIHIDQYGWVVPESESAYAVTLSGSYEYSVFHGCYVYQVASVAPKLALSRIYSKEKLT